MARPSRFALIGAAGFVAPRHMRAIRDNGGVLVAAVDPHDNVGVLDSYFPDARFFTEIERFDRHLEKLRRAAPEQAVEFVSVCSPNYLHDAHVRLGLRVRADVICEKPLVISPWNLDQLAELEREYGRRVHTILQLRHHPQLLALREELVREEAARRRDVVLTYITRRGAWYSSSWKGDEARSGGLIMNLGIHFFDLLTWLFGPCESAKLHLSGPTRVAGALELERARVRWFLSTELRDLPPAVRERGDTAYRALVMDGRDIEFSGGFTDLHSRAYAAVLAGAGPGIAEARPSIELVHCLRCTSVEVPEAQSRHPAAEGVS